MSYFVYLSNSSLRQTVYLPALVITQYYSLEKNARYFVLMREQHREYYYYYICEYAENVGKMELHLFEHRRPGRVRINSPREL